MVYCTTGWLGQVGYNNSVYKTIARARYIRIFNNKEAVEKACKVLEGPGFSCYYIEDKFGDLTLDVLGMKPDLSYMFKRRILMQLQKC